jgi:hypothetical protein
MLDTTRSMLQPEEFDFEALHEQKKLDKMDLWKAHSNLEALVRIFSDVPLYAMFGTLLGLVREGDLIEGDIDVDIMIREEDVRYLYFLHHTGILKQNCFRLIRVFEHENRPAVITFLRFGEIVDFYVGFVAAEDSYEIYEGSQLSPVKINRSDTVNCERLFGLHVLGRADRYLEYIYGAGWLEPDPTWHWGKKYTI